MPSKIEALRTPDERFAGLAGFDYPPRYADDLPGYEGLRVHYLDVGPEDARRVFLCLHGEPTWSYLYRRMIPVFIGAGHRVVAPDFLGFGRSDKPVEEAVYTFGFHRGMTMALIERLGLARITLVCQDWGGLLGLTLPMEMPERFDALLAMNTTLATGEGAPSEGFTAWRDYVAKTPGLAVGALMKRSVPHLTDAEVAAYDAPFPDDRYKAGVRAFPAIVPTSAQMEGADLSRRARAWLGSEWRGRSFMAVGVEDPVLGPDVMGALRGHIRGCPAPMEVAGAGHFLQEWGEDVARAALAAIG